MPDSMKKELTSYGVGSFFISSATSLSQVVSNEVRECTWLGYRPPRPVGETGGRYQPGRVGQSQTDVRGFFLCAFVPSFPLSDRVQPGQRMYLEPQSSAPCGRVSRCKKSGTVKYYAQIHLQFWQNSVCTGQGNLPLIT